MTCIKTICPDCKNKDVCKINISNGRCINYITDNITHAQHRLYRGILLPALTDAMGETNNQYVHDFIIKTEWIYRQTGNYYFEVKDYSEIPAKHQGNARILSNGKPNKMSIYGYVPSMANYTKQETKDYLKFCEILLEEVGGNIPMSDNQEYINLKKKLQTKIKGE